MLTQNTLKHAYKMKLRWFVAVSALPFLGVVTAFGIMPQTGLDLVGLKTVSQELALPAIVKNKTAAETTATFWRNERVQRGDTVAELLRRLNVDDDKASEYLRKDVGANSLRQLSVGKDIQAETNTDGGLLALRFLNNNNEQIVIEQSNSKFRVTKLPAQLEQRVFVRTGEIKTTLYAATDAAGLPDPVANQMAEIFAGDVDFHRELNKGDRFSVIYEMTYSNGEPVRTGRILGAEFTNQGKTFRATYFQTGKNKGDYYSPEGKSLRKAFLRSPIEFSRVSSGFSNSRLHPVLNTIRAHKGVDYAAPIGTKVKVTSDGTVAFAGKQNGFGNVVVVSHSGRYSTVYGHLSAFGKGIRQGQHVAQGDVIAYVGMTGLSSGPHLHYEFKIDGVQRDPLRVALPDARPISAQQKSAFLRKSQELSGRLAMLRDARLAKLD
jgi:murein DD-endopeptidase MepM/ murein hydrolase activator NlpD